MVYTDEKIETSDGAILEQVKKDEEKMQTMRIWGKNMAYFLKCLDAGKCLVYCYMYQKS